MSPWELLGLEPGADRSAIRRAYADRLRAMDPEADPLAFQRLRDARDAALSGEDWAFPGAAQEPPPEAPAPEPAPRPEPEGPAEEVPPIEIDLAAINGLRDMVMDPASDALPEEIVDQAERVLSDPAMLNVQHAMAVEAFFADLIVHGTPRSDPLIDVAVPFFGWDRAKDEIGGAPVLEWICRRENDRDFEIELATLYPSWKKLLDGLRTGPPTRWQRLQSWHKGHRVEYLLAYIQDFHPTIMPTLNQEAVDWWAERIEGRQQYPAIFRPSDRRWRKDVFATGFGPGETDNHIALYFGVFVMPVIFAWFLLRRRHGWRARAVGFGWLFLTVGLPLLIGDPAPPRTSTQDVAAGQAPSADLAMDDTLRRMRDMAPPPPFEDFETDLKGVLVDLTAGEVTDPADLQRDNRPFYDKSREEWEDAKREGRSIDRWRSGIAERAVTVFQRALRGSDEKLIADHASFDASRLRWALHADPKECAAILDGRPVPERSEFSQARGRLIGRALLGPAAADPVTKRTSSFPLPPAIVDDARKAARMTEQQFAKALRSKGTDRARCNAQIAIIEAAVRAGPDGLDLLRKMFGK